VQSFPLVSPLFVSFTILCRSLSPIAIASHLQMRARLPDRISAVAKSLSSAESQLVSGRSTLSSLSASSSRDIQAAGSSATGLTFSSTGEVMERRIAGQVVGTGGIAMHGSADPLGKTVQAAYVFETFAEPSTDCTDVFGSSLLVAILHCAITFTIPLDSRLFVHLILLGISAFTFCRVSRAAPN
jgi:hypothetical protein